MFVWIADPSAWVALATLTALEIVLGVDNIIFISILVGRLPEARRDSARRLGLGLAMGTRILLLLSIAWVMRLTAPLFTGIACTRSMALSKAKKSPLSGRELDSQATAASFSRLPSSISSFRSIR